MVTVWSDYISVRLSSNYSKNNFGVTQESTNLPYKKKKNNEQFEVVVELGNKTI